MSTDTDALVAFLRDRLGEDEQWALAASTPRPHAEGKPQIPAEGLHWQWGVGPNWDPVEIDPAIQEFVDVGESCVLISVETWQTRVGTMPRCYGTVEEMDAAAGGHIIRHDPARVLRDVESKRQIIAEVNRLLPPNLDVDCGQTRVLKALALPYSDHETYREAWRP